jgi:hypothetical protein
MARARHELGRLLGRLRGAGELVMGRASVTERRVAAYDSPS